MYSLLYHLHHHLLMGIISVDRNMGSKACDNVYMIIHSFIYSFVCSLDSLIPLDTNNKSKSEILKYFLMAEMIRVQKCDWHEYLCSCSKCASKENGKPSWCNEFHFPLWYKTSLLFIQPHLLLFPSSLSLSVRFVHFPSEYVETTRDGIIGMMWMKQVAKTTLKTTTITTNCEASYEIT